MSRRAAALTGVAVMVMTAGCQGWRQPGFGPGHTFYNPDETGLTITNVGSLQQSWTAPGAVSAVMDGKVIGVPLTTADGVEVIALDVATGEVAWSRALTPPSPSAWATHSPVVAGDQVWVGYVARTGPTCTFGLARLALSTGAVIADDHTAAPSEIVPFGNQVGMARSAYHPVDIGGGDTCMPEVPGTAEVVDAESAAVVWEDEWQSSAGTIIVAGDGLYVIAGDLRRYPSAGCGAPACLHQWQESPTHPGVPNDIAGAGTGPLVTVAPSELPGETAFYTIDPATGTALSETPLPFTSTRLALADGTAYVLGTTTVTAFDVAACAAGTCVPQWQAALGGQSTWARGIAVAGGVVYVGRSDGVVEAFPAAGCGSATCPNVGTVSVTGEVLDLAVTGGRLFVGSWDDGNSQVTAFAPTP